MLDAPPAEDDAPDPLTTLLLPEQAPDKMMNPTAHRVEDFLINAPFPKLGLKWISIDNRDRGDTAAVLTHEGRTLSKVLRRDELRP